MATNDIVINGLIKFEMGDIEMEKFLDILYVNASLVMNCGNCGTTIIPQCRSYHSATKQEEFKVVCIGCGKSQAVRMFGRYGFLLPEDDEHYKSVNKVNDGWVQ